MLGKCNFYENVAEANIKHNCKIDIINCLGSFCWLRWQVEYDDIFNIHVSESDFKFQYVSNFCRSVFTDSELTGMLWHNFFKNCNCLPFHTSDVLMIIFSLSVLHTGSKFTFSYVQLLEGNSNIGDWIVYEEFLILFNCH